MRASLILAAVMVTASMNPMAFAAGQQLTQDEVVQELADKPITTRSFGVKVNLLFRSDGALIAKSLFGDYSGVWQRGEGNEICSTFDSGPAKGTQCNTYTRLDENTYRTSSGTTFTVN